jgi:hypothetical protein
MTAPVPRSTGGWSVTAQVPTTDLDTASGAYVTGYKITFQTAGGHTGQVFVADRGYYPEAVKAIIDAKAQLIDSVGALTSNG